MAGWLVYGCRTDLAPEIVETIWRAGDEVVALVDNLGPDSAGEPLPPYDATWADGIRAMSADDLDADLRALPAVVPSTTPGVRYAVARDARARGLTNFPALVDPTAVVARTAQVADGVVVCAGAVVAALTVVGSFAMVNRSVSVGHHGSIGDYASLGPGCVLAGHVTVGRGAFIGAGAVCTPGVVIGANATVGAGAVVLADVGDGEVVVGNPARVVRSGPSGFNGAVVP